MLISMTRNYKICLALIIPGIFLLSFNVHQKVLKLPFLSYVCEISAAREPTMGNVEGATEGEQKARVMALPRDYVQVIEPLPEESQTNETILLIRKIIADVDQLVPRVTFTHLDNTTCVGKSRASIVNPRDRYCVGDSVIVQLDMYDYLGNRKKHGGDLLRARIHSPDLQAAASGKITDFHNGTYHVQFTLFWAGNVKISLLLIHPSEAVAALWRARNSGYDLVAHRGRFTSPTKTIETRCGFERNTEEEVCEHMAKKDEYPFYCIKPANMSCSSLTQLCSAWTQNSYLTALERPLFDRYRIRAVIPHGLKDLDVLNCTDDTSPPPLMEKCKTGRKLQFPGGYFLRNIWHPLSCSMKRFTSEEEINGCLKGKYLHLTGDSTMIQWMTYFTKNVKTLKDVDIYDWGWQKSRLKVDIDRKISMQYQKHGDPFVAMSFYSMLENPTIPEQIDRIGGHKNMVIAFNAGPHFKGFPLHIFIRRVINIRKAIQRLLLRSPETKVILKTENTSNQDHNFERLNDFNSYVQYLIMNSMMQDLDIGIVDAWDMTVAFASNNVHPPENVIENEINFFLTFLC